MQLRTLAAAVAAAALCTSLVLAQGTAPEKKPESSQQQANDKPEPGKTFVPGIEQFMGVMQNQHVKLWFAAKANNWDLADFQIGELKELLGDVQDLYPKFKSLPFADMIDAVIVGPVVEVEKAIASKNAAKFNAAFDNLTTACNSCHEGVGVGFVVIQRPTFNQFSNQNFAPKKK
jgi:hypothetical protein